MTVLIYDDLIKKSFDLDYYFNIFWKILRKFHNKFWNFHIESFIVRV